MWNTFISFTKHSKIGSRRIKTCLRGFWQSGFRTSLLSYRDKLENWNFTWRKFAYDTFQNANKKRRWSDCEDAQAGLRLCCSQTPKDWFSRLEAQLIFNTWESRNIHQERGCGGGVQLSMKYQRFISTKMLKIKMLLSNS